MTFDELDKKFDNLAAFPDAVGELMIDIGSIAIMRIKRRVIETGTNAEGSKYDPYSTKPMLVNCSRMTTGACKMIAGSKEKRKNLKWVTIGGSSGFSSFLSVSAGTSTGMAKEGRGVKLFELPQGYKQFREIHGRQTGFVDFSFTNEMWSNIKIVSDNSEHNKGVVRIAATTDKDKKKLEGNTKRRGDILKLSKSEIDSLASRYNVKLEQIVMKNGLK